MGAYSRLGVVARLPSASVGSRLRVKLWRENKEVVRGHY